MRNDAMVGRPAAVVKTASARRVVSWLMAAVLLGAAPLFMSGCPQPAARTAADLLVPVSEEVELGRQLSDQVEGELKLHPSEELQSYVRGLGELIVSQVEDRPEGIEFHFQVIDDPNMVNAFALPGGWVYVFSGLLEAMDDEAELVAVLAHEVAHVTRRHVAQRLVTLYGVDVVTSLALGREPGLLSQLVATVAQQGFLLSYSRSQEDDADDFGMVYTVRANYDPRAFITFFEKLTGGGGFPEFLQTHPLPETRIENVEAFIDGLEDVPTRRETERFEAAQRLL